MRRALSAMPTPAHRPCPSDPVATSTNGSLGVGCPSRSDESSAQLHHFVARKRAGRGPRRIQNRRRVAFRQHEAIGFRMLRIVRIEAHLGEEQRGDDLGRRQARRRMSGSGFGRRQHRIDAKLRREIVENGE